MLFILVTLLGFLASPARAETSTPWVDLGSIMTGFCVAPADDSGASGAALQQLPCDGSAARQWTLRPASNGYRIVSRGSGYCVAISQANPANGAVAVQEVCGGATATHQIWDVVQNQDGWQLKARHSGRCLEVQNSSFQANAPIGQYDCASFQRQRWTFSQPIFVGTRDAAVVSRANGLCVTVRGGATYDAAPLVQADCGGASYQRWTLKPWGDFFLLAVNHTGDCADVEGYSTADGARVLQYPCAGNWNQQWSLLPSGDQWKLVSRVSDKCLSVTGGNGDVQLVQRSCDGSNDQAWSLATPQLPAAWTAPITTPIIPIAVANLPNGKLLAWSAYDRFNYGMDGGRTYTMMFDPETNTSTEALVTNTGHDMFCPGTANMADGRILVAGGSDALRTSIYDPWRGGWVSAPNMNIARGYQGNTPLGDGTVLMLGGSWSGPRGGKVGELWVPGSGWRLLRNVSADPITGPDPAGVYRGDNHAWLVAMSGGRVLHAGPHSEMHWITTGGDGSITSAGPRGSDPYSMDGNAAVYDIDRVLKTGGAPAYSDSLSTAETYVLDGRSNGLAVRHTAPMSYTRGFHNSVVLPNGQVVVVGGQARPVPFSDDDSRLVPEIWDARTEVFAKLPAMAVPRNYHSTALLMANGKVFVGGGGQCGEGCPPNHFNAEILTPPYLLNPDGTPATRPVINGWTGTVSAGGQINAYTSPPAKSFVLMRLSTATHSTNNDQRRIPLPMTAKWAGSYTLTIPADRNVVVPGYYWLFALDARGVPSVGRTVQVR